MSGHSGTDYSRQSAVEVMKQLATSKDGLSLAEAKYRLQRDGPNILYDSDSTTPRKLLLTDPLALTLLGAALVSGLLREFSATVVVVAAACAHGFFTLVLARRHDVFMRHLQRELSARPTVLRGGRRMKVDAHELVVGDVVWLESGTRLVADARIVNAKNLLVNEQNLSGSAEPIKKSATSENNLLYAGSEILTGEGLGVVVAIANDTLLARRAADTAGALLARPAYHQPRVKNRFWVTLTVVLAGLGAGSLAAHTDSRTFWTLAVLLAVSVVPLGLSLELWALSRTEAPHDHHREAAVRHVLRSALTDSAAVGFLALAGVVSALAFHVPPALLVTQIVIFELIIQPLPIASLSGDRQPKKLRQTKLDKHLVRELLDAGAVAAGLALANYLFFFVRHHLALAYMNTSSDFYLRATTLALVTLALCQAVNIFCVRAGEHDRLFTNFISHNKRLLVAFTGSLLLLIAVVYLPRLHLYLGTRALDLVDWLTALAAAGIYLGLRLLKRHTRQHTRHAVIELHHKLHLQQVRK